MNTVNLIGYMGRDPELRETQNGHSVLNFSLAVEDQRGETQWFQIIAWNALAESTAKYCGKGSRVGVTGYLENNNYTKQDGTEYRTDRVVARSIDFLSHKNENEQQTNSYQQDQTQNNELGGVDESDLPF